MEKFFSTKANSILPYIPGEQDRSGSFIKLNTNENPYPPSKRVIEKIQKADLCKLRLYPDPESTLLRDTYSKILGIGPENIFVGNGSDEVLATAFQTFFMGKDNILMPDITYTFYPVYCDLYNIKAKEISLEDDFTIDIKKYFKDVNGVVIANPNAPTSIALGKAEIEEIVANNPNCVILVDEAYVEFGGETVLPLIQKYENLLIVRTLSKSYSLAGLRVGFAIGNKELIIGMNKIKNSFNSYPLDMLAQIGAIEAIKDQEYLEFTIQKIISTRERVKTRLEQLDFKVCNSKTNFLFISHKDKNAEEIFTKLKDNKILVRHFRKARIDNWLRVTIGTDDEMDRFITVIRNIIEE